MPLLTHNPRSRSWYFPRLLHLPPQRRQGLHPLLHRFGQRLHEPLAALLQVFIIRLHAFPQHFPQALQACAVHLQHRWQALAPHFPQALHTFPPTFATALHPFTATFAANFTGSIRTLTTAPAIQHMALTCSQGVTQGSAPQGDTRHAVRRRPEKIVKGRWRLLRMVAKLL